MSNVQPPPDTAVLFGALKVAGRSLRRHPSLLFAVIFDVILAFLALFLPEARRELIAAIAGVSVVALVLWRFGRRQEDRTMTIQGGRSVAVRRVLNDGRQRPGDTTLTITHSTGVTVEDVLNSGESAGSADPPAATPPPSG